MPQEERFGLVSQIRRAAVSIPANIAEGCSRDTAIDFARYLRISLGSANEVVYLLMLSFGLSYLDRKTHDSLVLLAEEIRRILITLIQKTRSSNF